MQANNGHLTHDEIARLVDPEVRPAIAGSLTPLLDPGRIDVAIVRALDATRLRPVAADVAPEVVTLGGADGSPLELRIHAPRSGGSGAALLWIHGGGMFLGSAAADDIRCRAYADALGIRVVAIDYRLAPEHPHPAQLDDCELALEWMLGSAPAGPDSARIAVAGASAGGGLAVALALRRRDNGARGIRHVQAIYPMLDDRRATPSSVRLADAPVWNARLAELAWEAYLGGADADMYAAPARAPDLTGLPSFDIDTAEFDMFLDEDIDFARALLAAGVRCELHVEPGTVHGFDDLAPEAAVSRRSWARRCAALRTAIGTAVSG